MSPAIIEFGRIIWQDLSFLRITLLLGLTLLVSSLVSKWATAIPRRKFPPGPKGLPFFGNVFQLGPQPWHILSFAEWKKLYGPIVYLNIVGQPMLILNDPKIVSELLDRRAGIYSDRPQYFILRKILTGGIMLAFMGYGELWRRMRRAAHEALNVKAAPSYHPTQQSEAIMLINDLIRDPENWIGHVQRVATSAIATTVYDMEPITSTTDPSVTSVSEIANILARSLIPGAYLVEFLPFMKYIPRSLAKWRRETEDWYTSYSNVFESRYAEIKKRVLSGEEQRSSFCVKLAETTDRHNMTNLEAGWLAATMYLGGADSSSATIMWFVLAMIAFPEAQRKAQAEIDEVVGRSRMPSFADWDHLPYVRALIKEVFRWRPTGPQAIPHAPVQDDWYGDYFIPKGTVCIGNVWEMNHDTGVFGPDALEFKPSRHLNEQGQLKPSPETKEEGHFSFGFGRRICVGRVVANYSAFINMTTILWALNLEPLKDANGKTVLPDLTDTDAEGLAMPPNRFRCSMTPRFPDVVNIVKMARDETLAKKDTPIHKVKPISNKAQK